MRYILPITIITHTIVIDVFATTPYFHTFNSTSTLTPIEKRCITVVEDKYYVCHNLPTKLQILLA